MRAWIVLTVVAALLVAQPCWAAVGSRVVVLPFTEVSPDQQAAAQQPDWINRALVQSVSDDVSALKGVTVVKNISGATTQPSNVDYVVSGTIQRVNGDLRVTGRVEDTASHQVIGGFKATGSERDLFAIEDAIAAQLKPILSPQSATPAVAQPPTTAVANNNPFGQPGRGQFEGSDLQRALEERDFLRRLEERNALRNQATIPDYTYTQPVYPVDYGYSYNPYNYYGYPYYGWGYGGSVVIINGQKCFDRGNRSWNGSGGRRWHRNGGGSDFIANPSGAPTQSLADTNGQAIRRAASFGGIQNTPSTMIHSPVTAPQLVPTRGVDNIARPMSNVPISSPQLVPHGGPQLVPGPTNVRR